ncbi:hypothetical protein PLESTB_000544000 [Pleodorina starrii]|uniref:Uncharacterized protein n=1 Tax=Pleodorina starrii TaxID=330485 RepID=A0A9W6F134_9CHLO|nr:hypothetical protein PLESTB_000544000 [Pleodorina starrii]
MQRRPRANSKSKGKLPPRGPSAVVTGKQWPQQHHEQQQQQHQQALFQFQTAQQPPHQQQPQEQTQRRGGAPTSISLQELASFRAESPLHFLAEAAVADAHASEQQQQQVAIGASTTVAIAPLLPANDQALLLPPPKRQRQPHQRQPHQQQWQQQQAAAAPLSRAPSPAAAAAAPNRPAPLLPPLPPLPPSAPFHNNHRNHHSQTANLNGRVIHGISSPVVFQGIPQPSPSPPVPPPLFRTISTPGPSGAFAGGCGAGGCSAGIATPPPDPLPNGYSSARPGAPPRPMPPPSYLPCHVAVGEVSPTAAGDAAAAAAAAAVAPPGQSAPRGLDGLKHEGASEDAAGAASSVPMCGLTYQRPADQRNAPPQPPQPALPLSEVWFGWALHCGPGTATRIATDATAAAAAAAAPSGSPAAANPAAAAAAATCPRAADSDADVGLTVAQYPGDAGCAMDFPHSYNPYDNGMDMSYDPLGLGFDNGDGDGGRGAGLGSDGAIGDGAAGGSGGGGGGGEPELFSWLSGEAPGMRRMEAAAAPVGGGDFRAFSDDAAAHIHAGVDGHDALNGGLFLQTPGVQQQQHYQQQQHQQFLQWEQQHYSVEAMSPGFLGTGFEPPPPPPLAAAAGGWGQQPDATVAAAAAAAAAGDFTMEDDGDLQQRQLRTKRGRKLDRAQAEASSRRVREVLRLHQVATAVPFLPHVNVAAAAAGGGGAIVAADPPYFARQNSTAWAGWSGDDGAGVGGLPYCGENVQVDGGGGDGGDGGGGGGGGGGEEDDVKAAVLALAVVSGGGGGGGGGGAAAGGGRSCYECGATTTKCWMAHKQFPEERTCKACYKRYLRHRHYGRMAPLPLCVGEEEEEAWAAEQPQPAAEHGVLALLGGGGGGGTEDGRAAANGSSAAGVAAVLSATPPAGPAAIRRCYECGTTRTGGNSWKRHKLIAGEITCRALRAITTHSDSNGPCRAGTRQLRATDAASDVSPVAGSR